ncbi:MAG: Response regulator receiver protein [Methanomicrobiales archaeon 53_19]|uniref:response regulator n=1 Tax=Methanocalculus sp. TaxID=2004547 RepID=UPI000746C1B2|nr:response regulator [Methanocalculus sp.]KUK70117.1 MAG: Response regulator receiver protein [Methanocalculus sp. 52_23]KUL04492.1 MAG: Response regulator receiver protein [Methanomicrobiales archaeon 53_19]HIJ07658.1 response regulator [Methanocalculus sp.]
MPSDSAMEPGGVKNGRPLILFVDDNDVLRNIISEVLEKSGYSVITADSGESCMKTLTEIYPEMILLDIMMEPMDGWETLRAIRKSPACKDIPIVTLTGKVFLPSEMVEYGSEISGWIKKPIRMEPFVRMVRQIFAELEEDRNVAMERCNAASAEELYNFTRHRRRLRVYRRIYEGIMDQCTKPETETCSAWGSDKKLMEDMVAQEEEWCRAHGII